MALIEFLSNNALLSRAKQLSIQNELSVYSRSYVSSQADNKHPSRDFNDISIRNNSCSGKYVIKKKYFM